MHGLPPPLTMGRLACSCKPVAALVDFPDEAGNAGGISNGRRDLSGGLEDHVEGRLGCTPDMSETA